MPTADLAQVRAMVAAYGAADERPRALALDAEPVWTAPEVIDGDGVRIRVMPCPSPLAVRAALVDFRDAAELLVVLTPCRGGELGLDVRARLVKGNVLPLDPFTSVLAMFRARVLDPQLVTERWLIDDLVALAPAGGWVDRVPLGGVLDIDHAWRTWHAARLHLEDQPDSLLEILEHGADGALGPVIVELGDDRRQRLADRWGASLGQAAPVLVDLIAAGAGNDLAALGLVAGMLWATTDDSVLSQTQVLGQARLENRLGRDRLSSKAAADWATAAATLVETNPRVLDAADHVLVDKDLTPIAILSDHLPRGFEQRLDALARAIVANDLDAAMGALDSVRLHRLAVRRSPRVRAAEAAVRLLRRGTDPVPPPMTFAAAADTYATNWAYVDEALRVLREGDSLPALSAAYAQLADAVQAQRQTAGTTFTTLLAEWSASEPVPDDRIVPLEHVLDEIVAPTATDAPVLLVVCDGMSLAVAHELLRDVFEEQWAPALPADASRWPVGVALLPTVTDVSRASLLSGQRVTGGQAEERVGFTTHSALRAASAADRPPILFHKAALVGPTGTALADAVRDAVADPDQRVVGVVVNSVDDHLARGDQVRVDWNLTTLRPLTWLLDAAAEAGRVVVLTADHGHVLHSEHALSRPTAGGGERWRDASTPPADGEIEIAGPRVLAGDGRVVLPTDDRLRYGGYKHGYHGGATPEEVLVPVEVFARRLPDGWRHHPFREPAWWSEQQVVAPIAATPVPAAPARAVPRSDRVGQASLFDTAPGPQEMTAPMSPSPSTWVDQLLESPAFQEHRGRIRLPRPISDDRLRSYLSTVDANGGSMPLNSLAASTGEPPDTLRMALSLVQRLVNLDGAEIMAVRAEGLVEVNRPLAALQFGIDA
jgi:hypothetical protein